MGRDRKATDRRRHIMPIMGPFLAAALGAGGAFSLYKVYEAVTKKTGPTQPLAQPGQPLPGQVPGGAPGQVQNMMKDYLYTVQVIFDVKATGAALNDTNAANWLKVTLEELGFKVLNAPQPRSTAELQKFQAGQPSAWWANTQWTAPGGTTWPKWGPIAAIKSADVYITPAAAAVT